MPDKQIQKWFCYGKKDFCDIPHKCDKCNFFGNPYGGELRRIYETNYDRIRNMSVEELAKLLLDIGYDYEYGKWVTTNNEQFADYYYEKALAEEIKWLESEVDNNG